MEIITKSPKKTEDFAAEFVNKLLKISGENAAVVGLYGELGSGKTTFVKGIAAALSVSATITSPTFIIEKIYRLKNKRFDYFIHIDAYRLEKPEELLNLGWNEMIKNSRNLVFVEWAERVIDIMPANHTKIELFHHEKNTRKIIFNV